MLEVIPREIWRFYADECDFDLLTRQVKRPCLKWKAQFIDYSSYLYEDAELRDHSKLEMTTFLSSQLLQPRRLDLWQGRKEVVLYHMPSILH